MKGKQYQAIYKKVDRSTLAWGITIPKHLYKDFQAGKPLKLGTSRHINILWDRKRYSAKLNHSATGQQKYLQIRYDSNEDLLKKLRRTFIQSYVLLESQKELFGAGKKKTGQFRSQLAGGQQEVLVIQLVDPETVKFDVFIQIKDDWNPLFQRLADENVFRWVFDKKKKYLISRSTNWMKVKDFEKHKGSKNVIYYLAHTRRRLLYIGKAKILGERVKPGRQHMKMPGDWDLFRYDIVKEYSDILERLEDHTIRAFASILKNDKDYSSLHLSPYKLVNSNWKKL